MTHLKFHFLIVAATAIGFACSTATAQERARDIRSYLAKKSPCLVGYVPASVKLDTFDDQPIVLDWQCARLDEVPFVGFISSFQNFLSLSSEQVEQIGDLATEIREKMFSELEQVNRDPNRSGMSVVRSYQTFGAEQLRLILNESQSARLRAITFRLMLLKKGVVGLFADSTFKEIMQLTEEQVGQLEGIERQWQAKLKGFELANSGSTKDAREFESHYFEDAVDCLPVDVQDELRELYSISSKLGPSSVDQIQLLLRTRDPDVPPIGGVIRARESSQ